MKLVITKNEYEPFTDGPDTFEVEEYLEEYAYNRDCSVIEVTDDVGKAYFKLQAMSDGLRQILEYLWEQGQKI